MKHALIIFLFTILVTAFYSYVGQMVPQKETYPPKTLEIRPDLTTEEMVEIGQEIVGGKGTCLTCHTIGSDQPTRFPDLENIGRRAKTRREGYSDVDYLAESLYDPNAYIVEGYNPGMPAIAKPPFNLTDQEILTVIAYLESLGSTPTVTMQTKLKYAREGPAGETSPKQKPQRAAPGTEPADAPALMNKYLCVTCHNLDDPGRLVGPSLYDAGKRLSTGQLYESILEPNATVAEGFPQGVMKATLSGVGFYDKITTKELKTMVDYLASLKGTQ
jgi:mono/diheme cytochrome c family protein